jgi:hypothetical protein
VGTGDFQSVSGASPFQLRPRKHFTTILEHEFRLYQFHHREDKEWNLSAGKRNGYRWQVADYQVGKSLTTSSSGSERAFRWTSRKRLQDLRQELLKAGVTSVQNWTLLAATSVSHDGTVIVGYGRNPNRQYEAWRAVLPLPR